MTDLLGKSLGDAQGTPSVLTDAAAPVNLASVAYCVEAIVAGVMDDIESRKGLGDEWDMLDDEMQREITDAWRDVIVSAIKRMFTEGRA